MSLAGFCVDRLRVGTQGPPPIISAVVLVVQGHFWSDGDLWRSARFGSSQPTGEEKQLTGVMCSGGVVAPQRAAPLGTVSDWRRDCGMRKPKTST